MGVRVNALCPGFFPAEQDHKILDATRVDNVMRNTPMARYGEPHDELVGATLLMLSRNDGGFTAMWF
jgi:NAD(P)-dependent dehydrogenase (short-subunit alcohol dehydrogenase family)